MAIITKTFKSATDLKKDMLDTAMKVMEGFYSDNYGNNNKDIQVSNRSEEGYA
nr:MAG TPA: hypothetical protein [Caudoviricetes sp.]